MENREELLYTYACEKFEQQKYDEALEAFILLYRRKSMYNIYTINTLDVD